jgi:L-ascorbate metabolism protein UlaG (beta-lactamase superfamily)
MIIPAQQDDALLGDITAADEPGQFHLWWLGQSGFLLKWNSRTVLFDPYLSDSLTEKYAATDLSHIRMTRRCVAPGKLGFVDVVAASHAHTDHLDGETLRAVARAAKTAGRTPMPLVVPAAVRGIAEERLAGGPWVFHGLDAGLSVNVGGFEFTGIPAAHDTIERDEQGRCRFLGYIVRFGPWTLYHSGDTLWHDELPDLLAAHQPDVMLLPVNGRDPARRVAGNLNGVEAAALAKTCGASLAIPHHFDMFTFNTATPDDFVAECARRGQPCRVLRCGERWSSAGLHPRR